MSRVKERPKTPPVPLKIDEELEALRAVLSALEPLDVEQRMRLIATVDMFFKE